MDSTRNSALSYIQKLPDFICTQVTHRDVIPLNDSYQTGKGVTGIGISRAGSFASDSSDVIEERLTFFGQKEEYNVIAVNGKKVTGVQHTDNRGATSGGEFGTALRDIFSPQSNTVFTWDRTDKLRGRNAYVFAFHVPQENGAIVIHNNPDQRIVVSYSGLIFIDATTNEVMRITSRLDLPSGFPIQMAERLVDYRQTAIAGQNYNLPYRSELRMKDNLHSYVNKIDFKAYRKFAVESTIHYGNSADQ